MKKKVDGRIRALLEGGVKNTKHRSMLVLVGDKGKDQVVNLHYILSQFQVKARPNVLWLYKKDLGFTTHRKKRIKEIKKQVQRGLRDADSDDPFELFISSTDIRYCYYRETHKILGNTFGMCVLQDFEAMTPNLLARTIETVEGGGLIIFLLKSLASLQQLYTLAMDVHARLRTEASHEVVPRFNERFILSLGACDNCLVLDDQLNVLPISSSVLNALPAEAPKGGAGASGADVGELKELKASMRDTEPVGSILAECRTLDQAKAILTFVEAISEKTLRSTVSLIASRGRGKSAALGLAIAAAVAFDYSNIFVTAPSPENLKTLFDFVFKGFDALGYKEHMDYELVQSTNPDFNKAIVRVNVFRSHRQTIQYIEPSDHAALGQAELVVVDEAAAIPLPIVKQLLGPYLVFLSSTVNGYEGTGRSLSLKLISQLREQNAAGTGGRVLREIELKEPIRYAAGDPIERWLTDLLCLDASKVPRIPSGYPAPSECQLYYVNRDTLFSYHKASEAFLQRMVSLFVSSHYKNTPDDLLLMSDAPAHHLFVLLGPILEENKLPEILCAVQVALEGRISRASVQDSLSRGKQASGDLIPWTVAQQFQDNDFPSLSGGRIVRIATHPEYHKMGYGSRALEQLRAFYQGELVSVDETMPAETAGVSRSAPGDVELHSEVPKPRAHLPPLLVQLKDRRPERLDYLGTSFGLTPQLHKFWSRAGYTPVYLRQTASDLTGEHTVIMLRQLVADEQQQPSWLELFSTDFQTRFASLLGYAFRSFPSSLAASILERPKVSRPDIPAMSKAQLDALYTAHDLKRLEGYSNNLVDYHLVLDLLPSLARQHFGYKLPVTLSPAQSVILAGVGLQLKTIDQVTSELTLPVTQVLALFNKAIRKFSQHFRSIQAREVEKSLPAKRSKADVKAALSEPLEQSLDEELTEASSAARKELKRQHEKIVDGIDLSQYRIGSKEGAALEEALGSSKGVPGAISVKTDKKKKHRPDSAAESKAEKPGKEKKKKKHKPNRSHQDD